MPGIFVNIVFCFRFLLKLEPSRPRPGLGSISTSSSIQVGLHLIHVSSSNGECRVRILDRRPMNAL